MEKRSVTLWFATLSLLASSLMAGPVAAASNDAYAEELTTLFRSARGVISKNQAHINNPDIGDKGLSGEVVVEKAKANYQSATGAPLDMNTNAEAKTAMLDAIVAVMGNAQELINEQGKAFKGFLPAIFARKVATSFNSNMSGKMRIKLTAPKNYVRNRGNRPDKWENAIIESRFRAADYPTGQPFSETASYKGKPAYRFILPEYYKESCLACHGEPKGATDITGGKMEGGKLNELGGAISLIIFD